MSRRYWLLGFPDTSAPNQLQPTKIAENKNEDKATLERFRLPATVAGLNRIGSTPQSSCHGRVWALVPREFDIDETLPGMADGSILDLSAGANGVIFDPRATCPTWEAFLHRIFKGD